MKILVTGGAGYKGVVLVEELLRLGHRVAIIDNFMYGYEPVLHLADNKNLDILKLDIRNIAQSDVSSYDVVYHLAGISGVPACANNAHSAEFINVTATKRLADAMGKGQILVNASTTSFYGATGKIFDESMPVDPISLYGQTKYAAEQIVQQRENSVSLRFATVFGVSPRMRNDLMVNDFVHKAVTERVVILFSGDSRRTFVHIKDAVAAYTLVLDKTPEMLGQVFNVGGEHLNISKREIVEEIGRHIKVEIVESAMPTIDKRNFVVSFDKIERLGYKTKFSLADGIRDLVKLYSFYAVDSQYKVI